VGSNGEGTIYKARYGGSFENIKLILDKSVGFIICSKLSRFHWRLVQSSGTW